MKLGSFLRTTALAAVVSLGAITTACAQVVTATNYECNFAGVDETPQKLAKLPQADLVQNGVGQDRCVDVRQSDAVTVRLVDKPHSFVTGCAVPIKVSPAPPATSECALSNPQTPKPIDVSDQVMISQAGNDTYVMTILKPAPKQPVVVKLKAGAAIVGGSGGTYMLTGETDGVIYAVYLANKALVGGFLEKTYIVEQFARASNNWKECEDHIPPASNPTEVSCALGGGAGGAQTNTSEGPEPPPR